MIKHWLTPDGRYSCNQACSTTEEKIAKTQEEVTCKNCLRQLKKTVVVKRKADIYECETNHRFAVIHWEEQSLTEDTICCPFCPKELAHYNGSFNVEVPDNFIKKKVKKYQPPIQSKEPIVFKKAEP